MKRDLISLSDLKREDIIYLLEVAASMKRNKGQMTDILHGKSIGLIFQKTVFENTRFF